MSTDEAHVTPKQYLLIGLWLGIFTIITVGASYLHLPAGPAIALALVIASIKVTLVGLYFMHLKFDTHLFRRLLVMGIILALIVYTVALTTLFHYH